MLISVLAVYGCVCTIMQKTESLQGGLNDVQNQNYLLSCPVPTPKNLLTPDLEWKLYKSIDKEHFVTFCMTVCLTSHLAYCRCKRIICWTVEATYYENVSLLWKEWLREFKTPAWNHDCTFCKGQGIERQWCLLFPDWSRKRAAALTLAPKIYMRPMNGKEF